MSRERRMRRKRPGTRTMGLSLSFSFFGTFLEEMDEERRPEKNNRKDDRIAPGFLRVFLVLFWKKWMKRGGPRRTMTFS